MIFKQPKSAKTDVYLIYSFVQCIKTQKSASIVELKWTHMFKMDNDPRITKVGKFIRKTSIDELPQFWNVLKGDMSLVGTRPPTVDEFEKYESHHKRRLSMKPGITGKWQVSGRSDIQDFEEVVKLDCEYIDSGRRFLIFKFCLKQSALCSPTRAQNRL
ncbi:MAG: sugar transferase [Eubacterium sp.]